MNTPGSLAFGTVLTGLSLRVSLQELGLWAVDSQVNISELRGCPLFMDDVERKMASIRERD